MALTKCFAGHLQAWQALPLAVDERSSLLTDFVDSQITWLVRVCTDTKTDQSMVTKQKIGGDHKRQNGSKFMSMLGPACAGCTKMLGRERAKFMYVLNSCMCCQKS